MISKCITKSKGSKAGVVIHLNLNLLVILIWIEIEVFTGIIHHYVIVQDNMKSLDFKVDQKVN